MVYYSLSKKTKKVFERFCAPQIIFQKRDQEVLPFVHPFIEFIPFAIPHPSCEIQSTDIVFSDQIKTKKEKWHSIK